MPPLSPVPEDCVSVFHLPRYPPAAATAAFRHDEAYDDDDGYGGDDDDYDYNGQERGQCEGRGSSGGDDGIGGIAGGGWGRGRGREEPKMYASQVAGAFGPRIIVRGDLEAAVGGGDGDSDGKHVRRTSSPLPHVREES